MSHRRSQTVADAMRTCFGGLSLGTTIDRDYAAPLGEHDPAEQAGVTRGTVTGLLDGLERSGFVRRDLDNADRRRRTVRRTASDASLTTPLTGEHGCGDARRLLHDRAGDDHRRIHDLIAKETGMQRTRSLLRVAGGDIGDLTPVRPRPKRAAADRT